MGKLCSHYDGPVDHQLEEINISSSSPENFQGSEPFVFITGSHSPHELISGKREASPAHAPARQDAAQESGARQEAPGKASDGARRQRGQHEQRRGRLALVGALALFMQRCGNARHQRDCLDRVL